ncbi:acetyl-CoA carboxylase biotin carboxyl carrier protein [Burkholderia latens]|uniref:Biotin carboxyl carrier protein of acetyl-CoA carboxylase n=1 Tax=Burkholderia latens TaxID=488446 RepID=A0A6H9TW64_9BURK|nr:biotin/lipoyl-containing protein [Burkholderia latens]KAB0644493.1 hypothetical protein F7R21_01435 [Burkholderia latens]VWB23539.1 acetyl-CoA carboxylase biotin carboxyl carrier protein subunit [Burkholderia latens]
MNLDIIDDFVAVFDRASVSVIDYTNGDQRIRLVRGQRVCDSAANTPAALPAQNIASTVVDANAQTGAVGSHPHTIAAGMIGTFYRASAPNQHPFVSPGDRVHAGMTLGLVEAMKLLNPIEADRDGLLVEILAADGAPVARDTPLFVIDPA